MFSMLQGYREDDGRFNRLPGKRQKKKLDLMLSYLITQFEAGRFYSETEVNDILLSHHSFNDPATLRRLLFGTGRMDRTVDGRKYWVVQEVAEEESQKLEA